jgi:carbamoyltransferase
LAGSSIILGVNAAHDAAACLLRDGELVVAIAEERLSRVKHDEGYPRRAVEYCLSEARLPGLYAVDCIVTNEYPASECSLQLRLDGYPGELLTNPSHHMLHAYYAWLASGFTDPAVLIVDGSGFKYAEYLRTGSPLLGPPPTDLDMAEAESLYVVDNGKLEVVSKRWALWEALRPYARLASLGQMYAVASQYIFGHWTHAGKTMGLAAYGDPDAITAPFVDLSGEEMAIDTAWVLSLPPRSAKPAHEDELCRNLAAKVQSELERAMLHLAERLRRRSGRSQLCLSGGVALNTVTNGRIRRELPFTDLFVTPAAIDAGVAIGAALYGHHQLSGRTVSWSYSHDYHGRAYGEADVSAALDERRTRLRWERLPDGPERAARDIADGLVIGWFEGGAEFGPRALGHRSILADPRIETMRQWLNHSVKYREPFRPYAASVLAEYVGEYFDVEGEDPFMLIVTRVRPERRATVPAVCHVDDTCRIQTVRSDHAGRLRRILEAFHRLVGVPLVLNTSFNIRGEPVVESPSDALDCFLASNMDVVYLNGDLRVTKAWIETAEEPGALVPYLNGSVSLITTVPTSGGRVGTPEHHLRTRTGHHVRLTDAEVVRLLAVDAVRTVAEIGGTVSEFADFQRRGFVSFGFGDTASHGRRRD